ncbi:MAG: hypothetical protein J7515_04060 [Caulobacter sp.]|nr:hypothetical protein [Caulobacter sp.]
MIQSFQPGGRPGRIPTDALAKVFEDVDISLFDLARANLKAGRRVIAGRTFRNCRIEGPAVMLVQGDTQFDSTNFGPHGDNVHNLILRPVGPTGVVGTIPVHNCTFIGCEFFSVGFTGPESFVQQLMALGTK